MLAFLCLLLPQDAAPAAGIAASLAQSRAAAITEVRYDLRFRVGQPIAAAECDAAISFVLRPDALPGPVTLDFDGELLSPVECNGAETTAARFADHVVIPQQSLRAGKNTLRLRTRSRVAAAGTPLSHYHDIADGQDYLYTLVVPADAHRLYPCFDQPDLRAEFDIAIECPKPWSAVSNGPVVATADAGDGMHRWTFGRTRPLPTYLMAFACGPFASAESPLPNIPGLPDGAVMRTWFRASERARIDLPTLGKMHGDGLGRLCALFGVDYPFGKLDIVLLPGFPYGGMEHAGAIFYRERALSFDHEPTAGELARRSTLIYHEISHQWFGNLVTLGWFDDLWLKEGFATFVAHLVMEELEPERLPWLRFLQRVKPRAYEVDSTPGSVPVYQSLQNLADAKSAYGPIVYNKAPAVLRELHDSLGGAVFRAGVRRYLERHAFGSASWQDLARALEEAAEKDLSRWSDRWILSPSMPQVRVEIERSDQGRIERATLVQRAIGEPGGKEAWPLRCELLAVRRDHGPRRVVVSTETAKTPTPDLIGLEDVLCVLPNPGDVAYGQFLPDPASRDWLLQHAGELGEPLLVAVAVSTLAESVREAECDPQAFAALLAQLLPLEKDADTHGWLLDLLSNTLGRHLDAARAKPIAEQVEGMLLADLEDDAARGRALQAFRWLARYGRSDRSVALCRRIVEGSPLPQGQKPGVQDRFLAMAKLWTRLPTADADALEAQLRADLAGQDVGKEAFLARAAIPSPANKERVFASYLQRDEPPEQWAQDSLPFFHWPGQEGLTAPFLKRALEQAQWVKANRRIFFMPAWLDAFVNGSSDPEALAVVDAFLAAAALDADVRKKLLQSRDGLARAVRIRARFGGPR